MNYKCSRFNYLHMCPNGELRMYNSMLGTKSLLLCSNKISERIFEVLQNKLISEISLSQSEIAVLLQKGYIVPEKYDEDKSLELRKMNLLSSDKKLCLIIMPTENCNFRCKYCYETFQKGKMSIEVQNSIIHYVRKNIREYTELNVIWFGGEPLEAVDVIEYLSQAFIKICTIARKSYSSSITTNGYNLTPDVYEKLYCNHVYGYQITLDGCKEQHDSQRILINGDGTFEKIVDNLLFIKSHHKRGTAFAIRTNFSKSIMKDIDSYISFFKNNFGDDQRFSLFIQTVSDWGGERVTSFYNEIITPSHAKVLDKLQEHGLCLNMPGHCYGLDCSAAVCYAAKVSSIVVGSDGTLYKCTRDFEMPENRVGELSSDGSLLLNSNWQLWLNRIAPKMEKCDNCFYEANCLRAVCPYSMVAGGNEIFCSPEKVNMGKFLESFNRNLYTVMEE